MPIIRHGEASKVPDKPFVPLQSICQMLKLSSRQVQSLISNGILPKPEGPRSKPKYDLIETTWAYFSYKERSKLSKQTKKLTNNKADDEYRAAKAGRERLKLDQERNLLMKKADVSVLCKFLMTVIKTEVLGQSRNLPALLVGKTEAEISDILEDENRKALERAATGFNEIESNTRKSR